MESWALNRTTLAPRHMNINLESLEWQTNFILQDLFTIIKLKSNYFSQHILNILNYCYCRLFYINKTI